MGRFICLVMITLQVDARHSWFHPVFDESGAPDDACMVAQALALHIELTGIAIAEVRKKQYFPLDSFTCWMLPFL